MAGEIYYLHFLRKTLDDGSCPIHIGFVQIYEGIVQNDEGYGVSIDIFYKRNSEAEGAYGSLT